MCTFLPRENYVNVTFNFFYTKMKYFVMNLNVFSHQMELFMVYITSNIIHLYQNQKKLKGRVECTINGEKHIVEYNLSGWVRNCYGDWFFNESECKIMTCDNHQLGMFDGCFVYVKKACGTYDIGEGNYQCEILWWIFLQCFSHVPSYIKKKRDFLQAS